MRDRRGLQPGRRVGQLVFGGQPFHPAVRPASATTPTPRRSDIDLRQREVTVRGKGDKGRIVGIGPQAARSLGRYLRAWTWHAQAWQPQLWLETGNREPLTAAGIFR